MPAPVVTQHPIALLSIADHIREGYRLTVHCHTYLCHRSTRIDLEQLAARLGPEHRLDAYSLRFRCSKCGARGTLSISPRTPYS